MYLSILRLWNFRKYGVGADNAPGLEVHFHEGVNVLIGENDSGKTTIVDAIRYALKTQSGEFIQFDDKDFYQDVQGNRMDEFKIECVFDGLNEQDSGLFWEWLSWNDDFVEGMALCKEEGQCYYTNILCWYRRIGRKNGFRGKGFAEGGLL